LVVKLLELSCLATVQLSLVIKPIVDLSHRLNITEKWAQLGVIALSVTGRSNEGIGQNKLSVQGEKIPMSDNGAFHFQAG
jgi:hypothetical protein